MTVRDLTAEIRRLGPWFHNLRLPGGVQTRPDHPLGDFPAKKWREFEGSLPADLEGWSVLDVGCNAGFYSFELARRGARVLAIDHDDVYLRQARWAAGVLELDRSIEFRRLDVYDLARVQGSWDLVLFLGVFYHLRYPLLGLDIVSRKVGRRLVFQSLTMPDVEVEHDTGDPPLLEKRRLLEPGWPRMAFLEHKMAEDPTNWWVPSPTAVEAMLRSTGMRILSRPGEETWICEPDREGISSHWTWNEAEYRSALRLPRT